jgi:Protein of unknown function (DUF3306)
MSFLTRWSRLKHKSATEKPATPAKEAEATAAAELPPVESLTFESDFAAYLRANVAESVKRAALKKLLHDPRFNVMDGLDTYIDDYTKNDPIPEEMLKTLEHARSTLFPPQHETEETAKAPEEAPKPETETDGDTRQDA